jgi:hypothetical protein
MDATTPADIRPHRPRDTGQREDAPQYDSGDAGHTKIVTSDTTGYVQVSVARYKLCGLKASGELHCSRNTRFDTPSGEFDEVAVAYYSACARRSNDVVCWKLGDGELDSSEFVEPPDKAFVEISSGGWQFCGLTEEGAVHCWGDYASANFTAPDIGFRQVTVEDLTRCGVTLDNRIKCWKQSTEPSVFRPDLPPGRYRQVGLSRNMICGLTTDGRLHCTGHGDREPKVAAPTETFREVDISRRNSSGIYHCGLRPDGRASCWGASGSQVAPSAPSVRLTDVSAGGMLGCGVTEAEGRIICWMPRPWDVHP